MERSNYIGPDGLISLSTHQYVKVSSYNKTNSFMTKLIPQIGGKVPLPEDL